MALVCTSLSDGSSHVVHCCIRNQTAWLALSFPALPIADREMEWGTEIRPRHREHRVCFDRGVS